MQLPGYHKTPESRLHDKEALFLIPLQIALMKNCDVEYLMSGMAPVMPSICEFIISLRNRIGQLRLAVKQLN